MYASEMERRTRSCYTFFWWHYIFLFDVTFFFDRISQNHIIHYISTNYKHTRKLFSKRERELEKPFPRTKNTIIMNQKSQEKCKKKQRGNVSQKICNPLVKAPKWLSFIYCSNTSINTFKPFWLFSIKIRQGMDISSGNEYKQAKEIVDESTLG